MLAAVYARFFTAADSAATIHAAGAQITLTYEVLCRLTEEAASISLKSNDFATSCKAPIALSGQLILDIAIKSDACRKTGSNG